LVAVAEEFGHQGKGDLGDEILESGVPAAEQIDAEFTQSHHNGSGVDMLAGIGAGNCQGVPALPPVVRGWIGYADDA
jgi:hypothetical protein